MRVENAQSFFESLFGVVLSKKDDLGVLREAVLSEIGSRNRIVGLFCDDLNSIQSF